jgi:anaerobic ribonucleoside-triphosphate reductase activating protein
MPAPDPILQVALIVPHTEAEGPGDRFAIWVQGCPLRCPGCCNPEMLAVKDAQAMRASDVIAQARALFVDGVIEGVSFLGGEPTAQAEALAAVAAGVQQAGLSVMVFSGYTLAELRARNDASTNALLAHTDLLVDGRYVEAERTTARRYIGSDNQVLHFLSARYRDDDPRFAATNTLEIRMQNGAITVNGFPIHGALTQIGKRP